MENPQYQNSFLKDEFGVAYTEQPEDNVEISQIVPTQDFNTSGPTQSKKGRPKKQSEPAISIPKKKGRPPLNRDENGKIIRDPSAQPARKRVQSKATKDPETKEKKFIPKMTKRVHEKKMNPDLIDELKVSQKEFLQPGVCYKIAPKLDHCLECISLSTPKLRLRARAKDKKEVDCRFFEFRKLVYSAEGELKVFGFLDPYDDPAEVDQSIWLPHERFNRWDRAGPRPSRFINPG